jgi:hypothetical protein
MSSELSIFVEVTSNDFELLISISSLLLQYAIAKTHADNNITGTTTKNIFRFIL